MMGRNEINHYEMDKTTASEKFTAYFETMDIPVKKVDLYRMIKFTDRRAFFINADSSSLGHIGKEISHDKLLQKEFLKKAGISVARSKLFLSSEKEQARKMVKSLSSAVVKPHRGNQAKGVTIGVVTDAEFDLAWNEALHASRNKKVLIEENFQNGILARYLVVEGRCISVLEFTKPFVTGNGKDTIERLIHKKNKLRKKNPHLRAGQLVVSENTKKNISEQGYDLASVPMDGTNIILDHKANPKIGSDTIDITDDVNPLFKKLAVDATKAIPGLTVAGVDLLALDHTIEPQKDTYNIIEMNNRPGLGGHLYTLYGYPRNVIKVIAKHILKTIKVDHLITDSKNSPENTIENTPVIREKYDLQQAKKPNQYKKIIKSENNLIANEFEKIGYKGSFIGNYFVTLINGESIAFNGALSSNFSFIAKQLLQRQYWIRKFLTEDGLSVLDGSFFKSDAKEKALKYAQKYNMQVQLEYRKKKISISSQKEFIKAWEKLSRLYDKDQPKYNFEKRGILVTRLYNEAIKSRYLVIGGNCVGVIQYISSPKGDFEISNITPYVHPKFKKIAEKAAKIVLGIDILGVDITSKDHFKDPDEVGYAIVNLKVRPSIKEFHYPTYGEAQNIAKRIAEHSVEYASKIKQFEKSLDPVEEAEIMPEKALKKNRLNKVRYTFFNKVIKNRFTRRLKRLIEKVIK